MRNTARWTSIAVRAALLLTLAVGTALIANRLSPVGIPLVGQWDPLEGLVHAVPQNDGFNDRIEIDTIETAKSIYDDTETLFVDARSAKDYEAGHVKGAVSLPLHDFDAGIQAFLERYPPEQPIVTYCS